MNRLARLIFSLLLIFMLISCGSQESKVEDVSKYVPFDPAKLRVPDEGGRKVRGQVLYMPVYSNIPFLDKKHYDLSAFVAVHNTDLDNKITITRVDYFNTDGKLVSSFVKSDQQLDPLATVVFSISKKDRSGTGANFLVEWIAEKQVNEPLVESVMKDMEGNLGISFLSTGKVIREIR